MKQHLNCICPVTPGIPGNEVVGNGVFGQVKDFLFLFFIYIGMIVQDLRTVGAEMFRFFAVSQTVTSFLGVS